MTEASLLIKKMPSDLKGWLASEALPVLDARPLAD
jgi:hypothetical protein